MTSLDAKIPKGWTSEVFESLGQKFKRAIDPDGCRWYWEGGWILNVPYFRGNDAALVDHIEGIKAFPITPKGTILIGNRRISPRKWNH